MVDLVRKLGSLLQGELEQCDWRRISLTTHKIRRMAVHLFIFRWQKFFRWSRKSDIMAVTHEDGESILTRVFFSLVGLSSVLIHTLRKTAVQFIFFQSPPKKFYVLHKLSSIFVRIYVSIYVCIKGYYKSPWYVSI